MAENEQSKSERKLMLGENTAIRLGFVVLILSGVVCFTWWASGVQSSLNVLLSGQSREIEQSNGVRTRIEKLERDTDLFMQVGSPALRARIEPLERWKEQIQSSGSPQVQEIARRMASLELQFETHKAGSAMKIP